jgi:hypothetical protein
MTEDRLLQIAAAAEDFVREFRARDDGIETRSVRRRRQQAALDALFEAIDRVEAERATAP